MVWEGVLFVDTALLFGLRSAPQDIYGVGGYSRVTSEAGRGGVINALPGRYPAYTKDGGGVPRCPAQTAKPIRAAKSASGARKAGGPKTTLRILGIELTRKICHYGSQQRSWPS